MDFSLEKHLNEDRFRINIKDRNGEVDVILGHSYHMLSDYKRDNIKLKDGWYYRNIKLNTAFLLEVISKYNINKINFIGTSKSCSGCIIFSKELLKRDLDIDMNLFMFSPYTTVDKEVYIKRNIIDTAPGSLKFFWESDRYSSQSIKRMEAKHLIGKKNIHMYLFYPEKSGQGEKELALRMKGDNVTHIALPVYMHNTFFPFWKEVDSNGIIELYENEFRKMNTDDYRFYSRMQNHKLYNFHLYPCLEETNNFIQNLKQFIKNEKNILVEPKARLSKSAVIESHVALYGTAIVHTECSIGAFSYVNSATTVFQQTHIGRYCSIGKQCEIGAVDQPLDWLSTSIFQYEMKAHFPTQKDACNQFPFEANKIKTTTIGNDVWIGSQSLIKRGVTIGHGAVVESGAVVTKAVPPYAIVGGVPAKVLKYRFDEESIAKLLKLEWWTLMPKDMKNVQFDNIEKAIKQIESIKANL